MRFSSHADMVFDSSYLSSDARTIKRRKMSGTVILDNKRADKLKIQPNLARFAAAFTAISGGLLNGIDWKNIFVAGGIALGALLCTDIENDAYKYINSDIDMYIYGVGPVEANEKIEHIYKTWLANLPPEAPHQVLRNSRTITCVHELLAYEQS